MSEKKRYVRKRRTDLALEVALRQAADATESGADPATKGLIQTRLNILNQQLTRERNEKFKRALAEAERLHVENKALQRQHDEDVIEIARLRELAVMPRANESLEEKTTRLIQQFEAGQL
jgi:hypothetical protein